MIPIRCITCNKVIAHLYKIYLEKIKQATPKQILNELEIYKYCCRKTFITNIDN